MKIAIPLTSGQLCEHFGHCEQFALIDADKTSRQILDNKLLTPPPHEPGVLPQWLHEQGAEVVIAGGMGQRAQQMFTRNGIKVVVGAPGHGPAAVVSAYLDGQLEVGTNPCDH